MRLYFTILMVVCFLYNQSIAQQQHIAGPPGSGSYGSGIKVLPNGNYIITDPGFDDGPIQDVGAVYLYNGVTHVLISTLKGSQTNDLIGYGGVTVLSNGNFIISSPLWNNGASQDAGAVTWGHADTGVEGVVSVANSLVGTQMADQVGYWGVVVLPNGNYLVRSPNWDNGSTFNVGAVTFGNGTTGTTGVVSNSNSLVGSTQNDNVGLTSIIVLANGNFVISTPEWDNGAVINAGAVTWGNGNTGVAGTISISNSLIGSSSQDLIGYGNNGMGGIISLPNGNYVVRSPRWTNGTAVNAGAVTWCNGATGLSGLVNSSNSLVGSNSNDFVGRGVYTNNDGITILPNGNYIVKSPGWNNNRGAVTYCNGNSATIGVISSSNSLVGSSSGDLTGSGSLTSKDIVVLSNGNYVINSPFWVNGSNANAGAVTFCNGLTGLTGIVSATNSLVGTQVSDQIGGGAVTALSNGNYVVASPGWNNGVLTDVGAITWCDGTTGLTGAVSTMNSLVGVQAFDGIGNAGVTALSNGNYVVCSSTWDNNTILNAGAITWCNGASTTTGIVSTFNSLVGGKNFDAIGSGGTIALTNGNYVVRSTQWDNGSVTDAGAITFGYGTTPLSGVVNSSNSLIGSQNGDQVGSHSITALTHGNYVVRSPLWDNGSATNAGAVTFGSGVTGVFGEVSASNSLVGEQPFDNVGLTMIFVLPNGNYIVNSSNWFNGYGAVTFCNGTTGLTGAVSEFNSLVGEQANDNVGNGAVITLTNGNYLIRSLNWKNGPIVNAGAYTIGDKDMGIAGTINSCNSVTGNSVNAGFGSFDYNSLYDYVIVGIPAENRIVIYKSAENAVEASISSASTELNCNTSSIELTASGGTQYSWSGGLGNSATAIVTAPGIYTVTVTDINGCTDEASIEITQNTSLPATPVVSGPVNVCMYVGTNEVVTYQVPNDPLVSSYEWIVPPTVTLVSGQGTASIQVTFQTGFTSSANKQIRVRALSACGNSGWIIYYLHAQAPITPASINGVTEVCNLVGTGNETTYSIQPVAGASAYLWSVPSGATITEDNGTSIEVVFQQTYTSGNVSVLALNNCGVSTFRSLQVRKTIPSTPGLISGPTNMCLLKPDLMNPFGSTAEYKIPLVAGALSYNWSLPTGITLLNQYSTINENVAFVEIGSAYNGGNISVTASNNCGTSSSRTLRLNILQPGAPSAIDVTELNVCPARIFRYALANTPSNTSYIEWTVPPNAEILNGFYTSTIEVLYPNNAISGQVTATAKNGCGSSSVRVLNVKLSACQDVYSKSTSEIPEVFVYPNPSSGEFHIDLNQLNPVNGVVEMRIIDVLGRIVSHKKMNAGELKTFGNDLKPGAYLVDIRQRTYRKVTKVVKL